jgi:hypothetical protein
MRCFFDVYLPDKLIENIQMEDLISRNQKEDHNRLYIAEPGCLTSVELV